MLFIYVEVLLLLLACCQKRHQEAYGYFRERAAAASDSSVFAALEGVFQARMANQVFLLRRVA